MRILFWVCAAVVVYTYIGYPFLLLFLRIFIHQIARKGAIEPYVTVIVPAYNEAASIEAKIRNTARLDYPVEKLEMLIASDGSTDETAEIARRLCDGERFRVLASPRRRGKISVLNNAIRQARGEIVILSDASAILSSDSVRQIVANFADPVVGAVSGTYRVLGAAEAQLGKQEDLYWKYETFLKIQESALSSVVGGHGQILAVRKRVYPYPQFGTINDDCVIPLRVIASGSRVVYEPQAIAFEKATEMKGFQRRVRIMVGNLQQLKELKSLLWPPRVLPVLFFLSHKVMRTAVPFLMLFLAASNIFLLHVWLYRLTGLFQLLFYALALLGIQWKLKPRVLHLPYYFCFINTAYLWGAYRSSLGPSKVSWK